MKKVSTIIAASLLTLCAGQALANPVHEVIDREKTLYTESVSTQERAYEEGMNLLQSLKQSSSSELKDQLGVISVNLVNRGVSLNDGAYITTQQYMTEEGELHYKGLVNIEYQYLVRENNS